MDPSHYSSQRTHELSDPAMAPIKHWIESYVVWTELPKHTRASILKRASKGEQEAIDALCNHNLRLLLSRAVKWIGRGVPLNDLIQEGWFGLREAAQKYEPERGAKFSTMAVHWIDQKLKYATVTQGRTLYLPHHAVEKLTRISRRLRQGEDLRADDQQWMDDLARTIWHNPDLHNVSLDYFDHLLRGASSIDKPILISSHGGAEPASSLADILPAPSQHDPSDSLDIERILVKMVNSEILSRRDGWLIVRYFGLDGDGGRTYMAIARELAEAAMKAGKPEEIISRQRVEQLVSNAMRKVRQYVDKAPIDTQENEPDDESDLEALDLKALLAEMINNRVLTQRYAWVLAWHLGLDGKGKRTPKEISRKLHAAELRTGNAAPESGPVTVTRISEYITKAKRRVRLYVQTNDGSTFTLPTASGSGTLREQTKRPSSASITGQSDSTESPKNRSTRRTSDNSSKTTASRAAAPVPTPLRAHDSTKRATGSSRRSTRKSGIDVPYAEAI